MMSTAQDITSAVVQEQRNLLDASLRKIQHCVGQLNQTQLWWRPGDEHNSIANLLLHLSGNLRQWIVSGVGGAPDHRDRAAEFSQQDGGDVAEVMAVLNGTLEDVESVFRQVTADTVLAPRRIQGFDVTVLGAINHSVSHFVGHSHQIILLTRLQLGESYEFEWQPAEAGGDVPI